jgi:hypothetical protein
MWVGVYVHKLIAVVGVQGHIAYFKGTSPYKQEHGRAYGGNVSEQIVL